MIQEIRYEVKDVEIFRIAGAIHARHQLQMAWAIRSAYERRGRAKAEPFPKAID